MLRMSCERDVMKLFGNDAVYLDGCFYRFDFGYRNVPEDRLRFEAQEMILRGLQRCMMPINAPYSVDDLMEIWSHDPRPADVDGVVEIKTIMELEKQRRLSSENRKLATATTVAVVRFPKQQMLHGAVKHGLPSPMWLVKVDREYEAGWVFSRRVTDIDKEARSYRAEWNERKRGKTQQRERTPKLKREMRSGMAEMEVVVRLADSLTGKTVDRYINPLHDRAKLRMVNLFEGWPHIAEVSQWLDKGLSEEALLKAGDQSYRQMQTFHGLSRADSKRTTEQDTAAT